MRALRRSRKDTKLMGVTHVTAVVRNPAKPAKKWEGLFLIDTGAVDCLVPGKHFRAIGLKPATQRTRRDHDGRGRGGDRVMGDSDWVATRGAAMDR